MGPLFRRYLLEDFIEQMRAMKYHYEHFHPRYSEPQTLMFITPTAAPHWLDVAMPAQRSPSPVGTELPRAAGRKPTEAPKE